MSDANILVKFTLKAVINKHKTRVLFAEVDNDFLNLLFSFLMLPLGIILQVLERHYGDKTPLVIGSLYTLYSGLAKLGSCHFQSDGHMPWMIFKPDLIRAYVFPHLNANLSFSTYSKSYTLGKAYFVVYKVFTKDKASFIICDDLRMVPNVKGSIVRTLNNVGVDMADMDGSEIRNVTFGLNEVMDFLKGLMISRQPLTDSILGTRVKSEVESSYTGIPPHQIQKEETANSEKMILKAMFHASTNKFLFVQAEQDFVSFIFTLLKIHLGIVDLHLGGNTFFKNLGNLYRSIVDLLDHRYLLAGDAKDRLMKPAGTFQSNHISNVVAGILDTDSSRMYMVTDDLTVTHLLVSSVFSLLNQMKISSSDVEEVELHIGLEEARNILKASLTSTAAFSDGLISPLLNKQRKPKQEH
ncbi:hypothetical protein ACS0TY_030655 [Phlomoides rotata]